MPARQEQDTPHVGDYTGESAMSDDLPIRVLKDMQPGDTPVFSMEQAPGAFPMGTRVKKVRDDPGDTHRVGDLATVLGSVGPIDESYLYFVIWDDLPGIPVGIQSSKLAALRAV